ncbi:MAG TPA: DUF4013 domain-containing protein [Terriglobales bacterium]|nr:DUF4013 domain-containing protein [Terriglobales bacterium]
MNLEENFSNSFEYTRKIFSDAGRLIILIVLSVFSLGGIVPVIGWVMLGYMARVLRESPGTGVPPKLEKYGELLVEGAKVYFAALIYLLVPFVLIFVGGVSSIAGLFSGAGSMVAPSILLGGVGVAILLVGIVVLIIVLIVLYIGLAHMVKTQKFGKAFAFGEVFSVLRTIGWLKYLAWYVVVFVILAIISAISRIPAVGWVISGIVHPIVLVFVFRSVGLLYNDGAPRELRVQPPVVGGLVCASCGTPLQPQHKFCPHCGAPTPVPPPPVPAPTTEPATKFCISCGAKIPANASFCGSCGTKQT